MIAIGNDDCLWPPVRTSSRGGQGFARKNFLLVVFHMRIAHTQQRQTGCSENSFAVNFETGAIRNCSTYFAASVSS